ncbi:MAG: hypothetical protein WBW14_01240 [Candidatus Acidiferrum sp.]
MLLLVAVLTAIVATSSYFLAVRGLKPSNEAFFIETTMYRLIVTGWVYLDRRCRALTLPFEFDAFMFLRGLSGFPSIGIGLAVGAVSSLRVPFLSLTVAPAAISVLARL